MKPPTRKENRELALHVQRTGDRAALDRLIAANMGLVHKYVSRWPAASREDMLQMGRLGIWKAAMGYDGVHAFSTYAMQWIMATTRRFAVADTVIRTPVHAGEVGVMLSKWRREIEAKGLEYTIDNMTAHANAVRTQKISRGTMEAMMTARGVVSLDAPVSRSSGDGPHEMNLHNLLASSGHAPDEDEGEAGPEQKRARVLALVDELPPLERLVMMGRYVEGRTLGQVGSAIGLTRERVRQLERVYLAALRARAGAQRGDRVRIGERLKVGIIDSTPAFGAPIWAELGELVSAAVAGGVNRWGDLVPWALKIGLRASVRCQQAQALRQTIAWLILNRRLMLTSGSTNGAGRDGMINRTYAVTDPDELLRAELEQERLAEEAEAADRAEKLAAGELEEGDDSINLAVPSLPRMPEAPVDAFEPQMIAPRTRQNRRARAVAAALVPKPARADEPRVDAYRPFPGLLRSSTPARELDWTDHVQVAKASAAVVADQVRQELPAPVPQIAPEVLEPVVLETDRGPELVGHLVEPRTMTTITYERTTIHVQQEAHAMSDETKPDPRFWITRGEVAALLGISPNKVSTLSTLHDWRKQTDGDRYVYYSREQVEAFVQAGGTTSTPVPVTALEVATPAPAELEVQPAASTAVQAFGQLHRQVSKLVECHDCGALDAPMLVDALRRLVA